MSEYTPIFSEGILRPGFAFGMPLDTLGFVPGSIGIQSIPLGTALSIQPAAGFVPVRVEGFTVVGDYTFVINEDEPDQFLRRHKSFTISVVDNVSGSSGGGSAVPSAPRPNLKHALSDGSALVVLFDFGVVQNTPSPAILPTNDLARRAAKDSALVAALRALQGVDQDALDAAMDPSTGSVPPAWLAALAAAQTPTEIFAAQGWQPI